MESAGMQFWQYKAKGSTALHVHVVKDFTSFLDINQEWDALAVCNDHYGPFISHDWFRVWIKHFGADMNLRIVCILSNGKIVGIFPFCLVIVKRFGKYWRILQYLQNDFTADANFLIQPELRDPVLREFLLWSIRDDAEADFLSLQKMYSSSPNYIALVTMIKKLGLYAAEYSGKYAPCIRINNDISTYMKNISPDFRGWLERDLRKIQRHPSVKSRMITSADEFDEIFPQLVEVSRKSWQGKHGTGTFSNTSTANFFKDLSKIFTDHGWLRLFVLQNTNQLLAFEYTLICNGEMRCYKHEYDESFRRLSPGKVLLYNAIKYAWENDVRMVNFCPPGSPPKDQWANHRGECADLIIFPKVLRGMTSFLMTRNLREIAKLMVSSNRSWVH
ncbi:MAG: GNAT family N-acetyltransferase [Candidatus Brocadia sp.]|nr:GNAT family N-acetyltransferase [Candidatus Brocadia sp.]